MTSRHLEGLAWYEAHGQPVREKHTAEVVALAGRVFYRCPPGPWGLPVPVLVPVARGAADVRLNKRWQIDGLTGAIRHLPGAAKPRGSVAIIVTLLLPVLIALILLVLRSGQLFTTRGTMQLAADAAALAGSVDLPASPEAATASALAYAQANGAAAPTIEVGTWSSGAFVVGGTAPNAVRVTVSQQLVNGSLAVGAVATAVHAPGSRARLVQ